MKKQTRSRENILNYTYMAKDLPLKYAKSSSKIKKKKIQFLKMSKRFQQTLYKRYMNG